MKCPYCSSENTRVIDSRPADDIRFAEEDFAMIAESVLQPMKRWKPFP